MAAEPVAFDKYEGLGNDFIVVESKRAGVIDPESARALCDRHFGIGADGVLLIEPPAQPSSRARMLVINADGSRPEMCGNGLRCVALHLARKDRSPAVSYVIDTDAGSLSAEVERAGDAALVRVGMGRGRLVGEYRGAIGDRELDFVRISMGNPHAVAFDVEVDAATVDRVGPAVSAALEGGSNVEFVRSVGPVFDVVVWERGVGRTLACGTGAAATAVAAVLGGRAPYRTPIEVRLPGGALELTVEPGSLEVTLRGPARRVFGGQIMI